MKIRTQPAYFLNGPSQLASAPLKSDLMRCQSGLQALGIALEHPQNLRKTQTQRAKSHDFSAARHVIGPIRAPSRRVACGRYQAAFLVQAQRFGRHAHALGSFGRIQKSLLGAQNSPHR